MLLGYLGVVLVYVLIKYVDALFVCCGLVFTLFA